MENKDPNRRNTDPQETAEPDFDADVAALLGLAVAETPPPSLKRNVMAAIRSVPQLPADEAGEQHDAGPEPDAGAPAAAPLPAPAVEQETAPAPDSGPDAAPEPLRLDTARRSRERRWLTGLAFAASALLLAAAGLGGILIRQHNQQEDLRQQVAAAQSDAAQMRRLLEAPDLHSAQAQTTEGAPVVLAYSPSEGLMAVSGQDLPDAPEGHGYELWLISADGAAPAGMVSAGDVAMVEGSMEGVTHLGITVEPAAGSPQPTTEPILLQAL
ncbi:hypothetical protein GCM10023081_43080 [Arthrobacter ginkgonis]|uniref:Anti-sigma K factor RskA C-terminal domain-containing protein n=1 Tax=Arthrobacter ginkgonis TaxID=1630594 RepID=A0ABP7DBK5_9MICC